MALSENHYLKRWRANFFAGLAIVLPAVISVAVVVWLFQNVSNVTDKLLFFLPKSWTHPRLPDGNWAKSTGIGVGSRWLGRCSLFAWSGRYGRNYLGRKTIEWLDHAIMRVPLMNKIYGTIKQVNESFSSNKSSFKQVVLVTFPHGRSRAVGFVTGEQLGWAEKNWSASSFPPRPIPPPAFCAGARKRNHQAGYVRGRRDQIHHQPGRDFSRTRQHAGHRLTASPPAAP
jgi:uncharacterized membrane protein